MGLSKLGQYIKTYDLRNTEGDLGEDSVVGISTQKTMIKTKANLDGVNLSSYKLFPPRCFAYVSDTSRRGDKISLCFNNMEDTFLVSSITTIFSITDEDKLNADYLFMYFNRPEFDRYSRFNSWGSARETFDWSDMCAIEIDLPPLAIQQKYVDVYNAMIANQQCYERGLDDLKLAFDALIDNYKHSSEKKNVYSILKEVDCRNVDESITDVQGINIAKQFMPSVANTNGVDISKYKIVKKGQFAFSGMQTGRDKCIRIALFDKDEPVIISPAYSVLEMKDNAVLAEYVMMWFSRKEVDRLGWFASDASIRTNLDMERFYEMEIPIPSIEIQQSIVDIYKVYLQRKEINERLKEQIKSICPILIKGSLEEARKKEV